MVIPSCFHLEILCPRKKEKNLWNKSGIFFLVYSKSEYTSRIGQCVRPSGRLHDNSRKMSSDCDETLHTELSHQYLGRVRRWEWFVKKLLSYTKKMSLFPGLFYRNIDLSRLLGVLKSYNYWVSLGPQVLYYGGTFRSSSCILRGTLGSSTPIL